MGWFSYSKITQSIGNALVKQEENGTLIFINKAEPGEGGGLALERITSWENTANISAADDKPAFQGLTFDNSALADQLKQISSNNPSRSLGVSIASMNSVGDALQPYKLTDLNITEDDSTESFKKYADDLILALKPYSNKDLPNEGYVTMEAIEKNMPEELIKIDLMSQIHKMVSNTLLKMTVPKNIASIHLNLVNNSIKLSYLDSILATAFENPNDVIPTVNQYKKETENMVTYILNLNKFFVDKGIEFGPDQQIDIYVNLIK